jgi:D-aspartate ligase
MGDTDLVRPLARAQIPCAVVNKEGHLVTYSRYARAFISMVDPWKEPSALVERMLAFARGEPFKPVLFYQSDADLLVVSRHRERLAQGFRFVVPEPGLVEDLVDKERFQRRADALGLPVPRSVLLSAADEATPADFGLGFPLILKPLVRQAAVWSGVDSSAKAVLVESPERLHQLWPRVVASGGDVLAQEVVVGPEREIESYHAYIDADGDIAGEFTGRKIRTLPPERGHSTAIEITDRGDVAAMGREVLHALGLRGVAKVDFKRAPDGTLWLLEVNPRFTLWNNPGSLAGVNVPALVYADLAGFPRPPIGPLRAGIRWCELMTDRQAARLAGVGGARWIWWALRCETKHGASWDDPMPFLRVMLFPFLVRRWRRLRSLARSILSRVSTRNSDGGRCA